MNQVGISERMNVIIHRANKGQFYYEEVLQKLEQLADLKGYPFSYSLRTFQRDLMEIRAFYGIVIRGNKRTNQYQIVIDESGPINSHLREALDLIQTFQLTNGIDEFVFFDPRISEGTQFLHELVYAIKNQLIIQIDHNRDFEKEPNIREIKPLALKEVKKSWYLIGLNEKGQLRNYGLDRIQSLKVSAYKFVNADNIDLTAYYKHVFGIFNDTTANPEKILLEFSPFFGNYIKSKPIHSTQIILKDDSERLQIAIEVKINQELISEILSFGNQVTVLAPTSLRERLKAEVTKILRKLD
jgi:predicted DNA-binding transcriptional regulator YafY